MDNEEVWILGMIKQIGKAFREFFVNIKVYVNRTAGYLSIINSGMIIFLVLAKLKEAGIADFELSQYYPAIFISTMLLVTLIGFLEVKLMGGWKRESSIAFNVCPEFVEMKRKIDELYEKEMTI